MQKIAKIKLKNFQCHKNLTMNLTTGMTSLMGKNNGGKSSAIRALYWIFTNSPRGDWMQREVGGKLLTAEAYVTFEDGVEIGRIKGNRGLNKYTMNGESWDKFGNDIPSPIASYINELQLKFGKKLFPNIHMQDDDPFMVTESSLARGALVNYLTGIDVGDSMKSNFNKQIKEKKVESNSLETTIADLEMEYEEIKSVKKLSVSLSDIQSQHKKLILLKKQIKSLKIYYDKCVKIKNFIKKIPKVKTHSTTHIDKLFAKFRQVDNHMPQLQRALKGFNKLKQVKLPKINLKAAQGQCNTLDKSSKKVLKLEQQITCLNNSLVLYNSIVKYTKEVQTELTTWEKELESFKGKECPTCGNEI